MTKFRLFILIVVFLLLVAVFSAGQVFRLFPSPDIILGVTASVIIALLLGYWFGRNKKDDNENE